jgi:hypothetical protein
MYIDSSRHRWHYHIRLHYYTNSLWHHGIRKRQIIVGSDLPTRGHTDIICEWFLVNSLCLCYKLFQTIFYFSHIVVWNNFNTLLYITQTTSVCLGNNIRTPEYWRNLAMGWEQLPSPHDCKTMWCFVDSLFMLWVIYSKQVLLVLFYWYHAISQTIPACIYNMMRALLQKRSLYAVRLTTSHAILGTACSARLWYKIETHYLT